MSFHPASVYAMQAPSFGRGVCAIVIGYSFGGRRVVVLTIALVCSASIIAASAQFSASAAELSVVRLYGTKFTIQTYVGFVPMLVSIHIMPHAICRMPCKPWDGATHLRSCV